jgi:hypothetical protein
MNKYIILAVLMSSFFARYAEAEAGLPGFLKDDFFAQQDKIFLKKDINFEKKIKINTGELKFAIERLTEDWQYAKKELAFYVDNVETEHLLKEKEKLEQFRKASDEEIQQYQYASSFKKCIEATTDMNQIHPCEDYFKLLMNLVTAMKNKVPDSLNVIDTELKKREEKEKSSPEKIN